MIELTLDRNVRDRWSGEAVLGLIVLEDLLDTTTTSPQLKAEIKSMISDLRAKGTAILDDPVVQRMRATFKAMPDMDPSRYRPASEALIRRCLEKDFVRINPIVDVNNILSIRLRVPLGIYDLDRISPACSYRIGDADETYATISQMVKNADGNWSLRMIPVSLVAPYRIRGAPSFAKKPRALRSLPTFHSRPERSKRRALTRKSRPRSLGTSARSQTNG